MDNLRIKRVLTFSRREKKVRLFRIMWEAYCWPKKQGFLWSCKLAFSLVPKLIGLTPGHNDWRFTVAFVQVHFRRSYGGIFV